MSINSIDNLIEDLHDDIGQEPTLDHLIIANAFWLELQHFWETLFDEAQSRIEGHMTIRIIDFDIIYPSCWPVPLQHPISLESKFGLPATAAYAFRKTKQPFTIPQGALVELIRYLIQLDSDFITSESKLKVMFDKTSISKNINRPTEYPVFEESQINQDLSIFNKEQLISVCSEQVDTLIESGVRLQGLNRILKHPFHRSWTEIANTANISVSPSDIQRWQLIFNTHRKYTISNYLDALNVASYNTLLEAGLSRRQKHNQHDITYEDDVSKIILPLLATSTKMILNEVITRNAEYSYQRFALNKEEIRPVSSQYLSFATVIEDHAENDDHRICAIAMSGLSHVNHLLQAYRVFRSDKAVIQKSIQKEPSMVSLSTLVNIPVFQEFCLAYQKWNTKLIRDIRVTFQEIARTDYQLNRSYQIIREALSSKLLEGHSTSEALESVENIPSWRWSQVEPIVSSNIILYQKTDSQSSQPSHQYLRSAGLLDDRNCVWIDHPELTQRILVRIPHLDANLFTWEKTINSESQLCYWKYRLDIAGIFKVIKQFLLLIYADVMPNIDARLFIYGTRGSLLDTESIRCEKTLDINLPWEQWVELLQSAANEVDYLRIETEKCTLFLDLIPASRVIGLEFAIMYEDKNLHKTIADLHYSSAVTPIATSLVASLLDEYYNKFQEGSNILPDATINIERVQ